jgi:aminoglycoside phosphotransferase (APT) family kinase protein
VGAPEAEIELSAELVRSLLEAQHPDLAHLPIVEAASGWDNVVYRVGGDLAARMPRRAMGARLLAHEQRWLAELALRLPLPVPAPVRLGVPGPGYPWPWSVVPWFEGDDAAVAEPTDWVDTTERLAGFLTALHRPAPADAPVSSYRAVPLPERAELLRAGLERLGDTVDQPRIEALWAVLAATSPWPGPPVWVHGDLHPRNIVLRDGRLAAIVDFGDLTAGDPAVDLSVAWFWLPGGLRGRLRAAYGGGDDDTWQRAKGWALALSIAHLGGDARVIPLGRQALAAVLADPG